MGYIVLIIVLIIVLGLVILPGIYFTWKDKDEGKFYIEKNEDGTYSPMVCYRGEWVQDSKHETEKEAREYIMKKKKKLPHTIPTKPWVK